MPLDSKQLKRVAPKGLKKVYGPSSGNKTQITILACANAMSNMLPPMVISKGERFNHDWVKGEIPNTLYGMSPNGWIDQELFTEWLQKLFIPNIPSTRPVLLLWMAILLILIPKPLKLLLKQISSYFVSHRTPPVWHNLLMWAI